MEQVKYIVSSIKEFIMHHKALALVIGCIMLFDSSLVGVISDVHDRKDQQSSRKQQMSEPTRAPVNSLPSLRPFITQPIAPSSK